jgi:phage/plasmid primase-like uncharacterized protein
MSDPVEAARAVSIVAEADRRGIKLRRCGHELIGPCPRCGGRDRFSINASKNCWNCRQCKPATVTGDVIGFVMWLDGVEFPRAVVQLADERAPRRQVSNVARVRHLTRDDADRIRFALRFWQEAVPITGTIGEVYFRRWRGIAELPPDAHEVLRFHPRCRFGPGNAEACILALYRDGLTDEPTGVHRIAIGKDGKLIGRKALGRKQGSAVKLWGDAEIGTALIVGEGIETVLSAATRVTHRGTRLQPAWSLIDAPNLKAFPFRSAEEAKAFDKGEIAFPIAGIEFLTILADHDEAKRRKDGTLWYPGQEAARTCAKRWAAAGIEAEVLTPDRVGSDFNDLSKQITAVAS